MAAVDENYFAATVGWPATVVDRMATSFFDCPFDAAAAYVAAYMELFLRMDHLGLGVQRCSAK